MPSWLAYAAGGALSGLGQGLVKKGESEQEQRKALALANLAKDQATTLEGMRQQGETDRQTAADNARMARQKDDQSFTEKQGKAGAEAAASAAAAKFQRDKAMEYIRAGIAEAKARGDQKRAIELANLSMKGVESIHQASDGTFFAVTKGGAAYNLSNPDGQAIVGVPPKPQGGSDPYPGIVTGAPATNPARNSSATSGGIAMFGSDDQANAFVGNPANKGKPFIGPDGKRRIVP